MSVRSVDKYVQYIVEWKIVVCKKCKYAVWPKEITSHFTGHQHRLGKAEVCEIQAQVDQIAGLATHFNDVPALDGTVKAFNALHMYSDGLLCTIDPDHCKYICRHERSIKKHCQQHHGWVRYRRRGRPSKTTQRRVQEERPVPWKQVTCQTFFVQGLGKRFFEVDAGLTEEEVVVENLSLIHI